MLPDNSGMFTIKMIQKLLIGVDEFGSGSDEGGINNNYYNDSNFEMEHDYTECTKGKQSFRTSEY